MIGMDPKLREEDIEMIRIDYFDVYSVINIALVVIGYAQMVVCWTTKLYRITQG